MSRYGTRGRRPGASERTSRRRRALLAAGIGALAAAALCAAFLLASAASGVAPQDLPLYFADQTGIASANEGARASVVSYSAYASMADQTWVAGQTEQETSIWLPATATHTGEDGEEVVEDNPVYAAPHVYLDLDGDGKFARDECVYNPMEYDDEDNVTNVGDLLRPGHEVTRIELTRPLEAGEYDAELLWTGLTIEDGELANPMTFKFHVSVE